TVASGVAPAFCTTTITLGCTSGTCFPYPGTDCSFFVAGCAQAGPNCCAVVAYASGGGVNWIICATPPGGPGVSLGHIPCGVYGWAITFGATGADCDPF